MSLNVRALRASRVRDDQAVLAQVKARLQKAMEEQAAADALLAEAKRAAEDLASETRELQDVEQKMAAKLASSRASLVQECVSTLPDDVLRCIFAQVVSDGRPHAPFALAAVCGRWRRVALDSASLWSTIHIVPVGIHSNPRKVLSTEYDRAVILLSRSRSAPLDIEGPASLYSGDEVLRLIRRILNLLGSHVSRWKFAALLLPEEIGSSSLDFLKGPTPLLVRLTVAGSGYLSRGIVGPSGVGYLPFAPQLQYLSIGYVGMGCSTRQGFPAMKKLNFSWGACTDDQIFDFLRMSSQSLQELVLCQHFTHGPRTTIHLPNLNYLFLSAVSSSVITSTPLSSIVTPALAHLHLGHIPATSINDAFLPFLDAVSATVRRLTVATSLSPNSLLVLAHLRNLEQLDSSSSASFASDDALELLSTNDPPIWPRLSRLVNWTISLDSITSSEALLRFIESRKLPGENDDPGVVRPCKLREVTLHRDTPQWLVAEVGRLLEY